MNLRKRTPLNLGRYGEIISILVKYGYGDIIARLNLEKYLSLPRQIFFNDRKGPIAKESTSWSRIRKAVEELGPTFIKLGQFLSNRPELFPDELVTELEELQDNVSPFPSDIAVQILEEELKAPIQILLKEFSPKPIASASIAQVHKATLKDGQVVAIKIQRPGIRDTIEADLQILHHFFVLLERSFDKMKSLNITQLIDEFERMLVKETNFQLEAANMERFTMDFKGDPQITIPAIFKEYSSRHVLTTEFIKGVKVSNIDELQHLNLDTSTLAENGAKAVLKQIFDNGLFHADPHPGNILIQSDGKICFLDFGAVGIVPPTLRHHLSVLMFGFVTKDPTRIIKSLSQLARNRTPSMEHLEYEVTEFIETYAGQSLTDININDLLQRLFDIIVNNELRVVPGFYPLLKSLITFEGVGRKLDPDFHLITYFEPFVRKWIRHNPALKQLPFDLYFTMVDLAVLVRDLPFEIKDMLRIIKGGELSIQYEHKGLEPLMHRHSLLVNRLVFAIVLASLIIGSSIVIHADIPPKFFDIPIFGIAGFLIAGLIGFGLLFTIIRHRKM